MSPIAPTCLTRIDPARNMARYYRMDIAPDLFGGVTLTRNWGRIGTQGAQRCEWFPAVDQAESARLCWIDRKIRKGYGVCPATG